MKAVPFHLKPCEESMEAQKQKIIAFVTNHCKALLK